MRRGGTVLRTVLTALAVLVAAALAAVQLASSAAYGDLAARPSLPAALHAADPGLLRPFLGDRPARAAAAVHGGDLAGATALLAPLPDDARVADLRGRIAEARGARAEAIGEYVRAGDVVRAQGLIDALAASDLHGALAAENGLVANLGGASAVQERGQALWRLGQLQASVGYADPARRRLWWAAAERSYEKTLALAPNEETYLLAAGYQSLANGDASAALRYYTHAADVVPNSGDAYAGLAWTDAARGDCAAARSALERARALRPTIGRDPVDDPNVGAPLKRCGA